MNPQELRIGNWVRDYYGKYRQVVYVGDVVGLANDFGGTQRYQKDPIWSRNLETDLHPIQLTPEIVKKCGFKKHDNSNGYWTRWVLITGWHISEAHHSEPSAGVEEGLFYWGEDYVRLKYLHQLQNLYYALTRAEIKYAQ